MTKEHFIENRMADIHAYCEYLYRNKSITILDKELLQINLKNLDTILIVSWMCATLPFKEMLNNRVQLIENCKNELIVNRKIDDLDEIFKNLE